MEYLLNKTYDDEMTKCLVITAITKLHSNLNFIELDFIDNIIQKYSKDQNVEIQQRCLEYKKLIKTRIPIAKNQFTTILDDIDIDTSLSFLDNFVSQKISQGAKEYDRERYEHEKNIFTKGEKELVIGPYQAPELMDATPSKNSNKLTSLYEDRQDHQKKVLNTELKVNNNGKKYFRLILYIFKRYKYYIQKIFIFLSK
jgi:hypothetical protein